MNFGAFMLRKSFFSSEKKSAKNTLEASMLSFYLEVKLLCLSFGWSLSFFLELFLSLHFLADSCNLHLVNEDIDPSGCAIPTEYKGIFLSCTYGFFNNLPRLQN